MLPPKTHFRASYLLRTASFLSILRYPTWLRFLGICIAFLRSVLIPFLQTPETHLFLRLLAHYSASCLLPVPLFVLLLAVARCPPRRRRGRANCDVALCCTFPSKHQSMHDRDTRRFRHNVNCPQNISTVFRAKLAQVQRPYCMPSAHFLIDKKRDCIRVFLPA